MDGEQYVSRPPSRLETETETLRRLIVALMLAWRREFLASGGSALKQWEQIETRMVSAAKRTGSMLEWPTLVARGLRLGSPSRETSSAMLALARHADDMQRAGMLSGSQAMALVERERGLLVALAREQVDRRRAERAAVDAEHPDTF